MQVEQNEINKVSVKRLHGNGVVDVNDAIFSPSEIRVVPGDGDIVPIRTVNILTYLLICSSRRQEVASHHLYEPDRPLRTPT